MKFRLIERNKNIHKETIDDSQPFLPSYDLSSDKTNIITVYIAKNREGNKESNNLKYSINFEGR